jgi:hypothetical protein
MLPLVGAGWLRFTVHVLEEAGPRMYGLQETEDTVPEVTRVTVKLAELPL